MALYVDNMRAGFGRMVMCHMIADSREELDQMADAIGVPRRWIQKAGTIYEHYDVCLSKRRAAIRAGAVALTQKELGRKIYERRRAS